jgi:hypothetical protein
MTAEHANFIAKLREIEEHANALRAELAPGLASARVRHIVGLAKTLRGRLEFGGASIMGRAPAPAPREPSAPG